MKKITIPLCLALSSIAYAAEPIDPMECSKVAEKFSHNPFRLTVGEYDTLSLCAYQFRQMVVDSERAEKEDKAIQHNFFPKKMEDGE